jgi:hypothetical protein
MFGQPIGIILGLPLLLGGIVIHAQPAPAIVLTERFDEWVLAKRSSAADRRFRHRLFRSVLAGFGGIRQWTERETGLKIVRMNSSWRRDARPLEA